MFPLVVIIYEFLEIYHRQNIFQELQTPAQAVLKEANERSPRIDKRQIEGR